MNPQEPTQPIRIDPAALPRPKWWGRYVLDGDPPQRRFVLHWGPILAAVACILLTCYLSAVTALWGYYSIHRKIPGVNWADVALPPRFSHVQSAIGAYYLGQAKDAWVKKDYARGIVTAKAAIVKSPGNLDARLFLAECWSRAGRYDEAIRTLREGIPFSASDTRLQNALVGLCIVSNRDAELLAVLRTDLPARGVRLLDGSNRGMQLAEVRAVLEVSGAAEAERVAREHPGLVDDPLAAPLLANIEREAGRKQQALEILRVAHDRAPKDAVVQDQYVTMAIETGNADLARTASEKFLAEYPELLSAQLRFLEAHGSRRGSDEKPWTSVSLKFMAQHRREPDALSQLGSLAASNGWQDLAYLLYENSLQENLTGFPFATYYVASLVKAGDFQAADAALRELSVRNGAQMQAASYIAAMVDWGIGRESEATQIVQELRRETADDPHRRRTIENVFRSFGFPKVADQLAAGGS
jgi:tetratricopeptide (TPR) repeat protein